jgi:ABC-2 type transport system ATP-binding protein
VAYVSEQPYFYRYLTGRESLRFIYDLLSPTTQRRSEEIDFVLEKTGLTDAAERRVADYSKGMLQRLNMAQALLGNPDIYILDEPMSGMDPIGRRLFRSIIRDLGEAGKCVFFSSHVLSDVEALCDGVIALSRGSVVYRGDLESLLEGGRLGTDIEVGASTALGEALERRGCSVALSDERIRRIFVPQDVSTEDVLKLLSDADVYPSAVRPRERSLEDVLYSREQSAEE